MQITYLQTQNQAHYLIAHTFEHCKVNNCATQSLSPIVTKPLVSIYFPTTKTLSLVVEKGILYLVLT